MPAVRVIAALQGKEVFCKEKGGIFEGSVIRCHCCNKEFAPSAFEHHSGSSFRRPWKSIKDSNGKSIQEYREEYEQQQAEGSTSPLKDASQRFPIYPKPVISDDLFVVEKIISSRVRNGRKEYLVKWQNFDSPHNTWIPPENFGSNNLIAEFENKMSSERKRKASDFAINHTSKLSRPSGPLSGPDSEDDDISSPDQSSPSQAYSPPGSREEWPNSGRLSTRSQDRLTSKLEPLFADVNNLPADSPLLRRKVRRDDFDDFDFPSDLGSLSGEEIGSDPSPLPITTITVDYEGMKGVFVQVTTFRELLECALEYWDMSELTSPKNWMLTNEKGAVWPLNENIDKFCPEVVYLKRKPWNYPTCTLSSVKY
jgi:hypothetical protein